MTFVFKIKFILIFNYYLNALEVIIFIIVLFLIGEY